MDTWDEQHQRRTGMNTQPTPAWPILTELKPLCGWRGEEQCRVVASICSTLSLPGLPQDCQMLDLLFV